MMAQLGFELPIKAAMLLEVTKLSEYDIVLRREQETQILI